MPRADERFMLANGLRHHVLVWNDAGAPTFVLCHGYLDQAWSFDGVAQHLADAGARVVAFDWRGHGRTDHIGRGGYYHFADYVLDLHELMPLLAAGDTHLVGHSMGGTASALYAATHPAVPRTLTLIEGLGPPAPTMSAPEKMVAWLESVERMRRKPIRPITDLAEAVTRLRAMNADLPADLALELAAKATEPCPDAEGLQWRFDRLHRTTSPSPFSPEVFRSFLTKISCPTLVVSGERGFRTADHEQRVAALRDATQETFPNVGHMIHQLAPEALAHRVLQHAGTKR